MSEIGNIVMYVVIYLLLVLFIEWRRTKLFPSVRLMIVHTLIVVFLAEIMFLSMKPGNNFDKSMKLNAVNRLYLKLFDSAKYRQYNDFKNLYLQNIDNQQGGNIPKIIHQIWVGNSNIPSQYQYYQSTWKKIHPSWQYRLWTNADIKSFSPKIQELFYNARSFAEQADILRLEILKENGGVYVDLDTECFASLDPLIEKYNFIAVTASTDLSFEITNSLIASEKNHPILISSLNYLNDNWLNIEKLFDASNKSMTFHGLATRKTMFPLEYGVTNYVQNHPDDKEILVLPIGYCNPFYKNLQNLYHKVVLGEYQYDITDERICIHYNRKYLSLYPKKDFLLEIFNGSHLNKYLYKYAYGKNIRNKIIEDSYEKNNQAKKEFSSVNKIPLIIHLVNLENNNLEQLSAKWQQLNPDFIVKIWSKDDLKQAGFSIDDKNPQFDELLYGVKIIAEQGGVFARISQQPRDNLFELCNKYKFFGFIKHKTSLTGNLEFSSDLIGATQGQKIITEIIKSNPIDQSALSELITNNYYKFWMIDGPVVALP